MTQPTLFDLDEVVAAGGSRTLYEKALSLLSREWKRWGDSPLTYADHEWLFTALEHLWQCDIIERKTEPIEDEWGRGRGWNIYFRLKT